LGCREFVAYFSPPASQPAPVDWSQDLGLVLYDVFDLSRPGGSQDQAAVSLFHASVRSGVVEVPDYAEDQVLKASGWEAR
jgi:CRISPR-associated protein Cas5d